MAVPRWRFFRAPVPLWRVVVAVLVPFWLIGLLKEWAFTHQLAATWGGTMHPAIIGTSTRILEHTVLTLISAGCYIFLVRLSGTRLSRFFIGLSGLLISLLFAALGRFLLIVLFSWSGQSQNISGTTLGGIYNVSFVATPHITLWSMLDWFMTFWAGFALVWGVYIYLRLRDEELRSASLRSQWLSARLESLIGQLNPHFLFNSLHTISAFIHKDQDRADELVMRLGDLLRRSLLSKQHVFITLEEELEAVRLYLAIEHTRFEDKMSVDMDIDPASREVPVPPFIMQPLVENAIKHGISADRNKGYVNIEIRCDQRRIHIKVVNSVAVDRKNRSTVGVGAGVRLTRERLQTIYGHDFDFCVGIGRSGSWEASMDLPILGASELVTNGRIGEVDGDARTHSGR